MPEPEYPVDLRDDGTVRLAFDKGVITLRRPLIGELRDLHEALSRTNDSVADLLHLHPSKPAAPERTDGQSDEDFAAVYATYAAARDAWRVIDHSATADMDTLRVGWARQVVETLGDKTLPPKKPPTELPTWAMDTRIAVALVNHWQTVPLARGGR